MHICSELFRFFRSPLEVGLTAISKFMFTFKPGVSRFFLKLEKRPLYVVFMRFARRGEVAQTGLLPSCKGPDVDLRGPFLRGVLEEVELVDSVLG